MVSARHVLPLCVLLVLAGCNGILPGPGTPTDSTTTSVDYPPGLVVNGVSSPDALSHAHGDALANTSFAYSHSIRATRNGTLASSRNQTLRATAGGERVLSTTTASGPVFYLYPQRAVTWSNGTVDASKFWVNGSVRYAAGRNPYHPPDWPTLTTRVYSLYLALSFDVEHTSDGFTLTATGARHPDAVAPYFENESNVSLTMHLDRRGVVRSYRLEFDGVLRGNTYHVVETYDVTQLGGVTVERPPWVDEALNVTGGS